MAKQETIDKLTEELKKIRVHWLLIADNRNTEILGTRCGGKNSFFRQLDWSEWWLDGGVHMFNAGGTYFHVTTKEEGCVFRVRCWWAGGKYKGREVTDIDVGMKGGQLHWIVRTKEGDK